jgi:(2Fe-2S) ferredoxin
MLRNLLPSVKIICSLLEWMTMPWNFGSFYPNLLRNQPIVKHYSQSPECVFYVCCGSKCKKKGGKPLLKVLKGEMKHRQLKSRVQVIKTGCTDRCKSGPVLAVMPTNEWHLEVSENRAIDIFNTETGVLHR